MIGLSSYLFRQKST